MFEIITKDKSENVNTVAIRLRDEILIMYILFDRKVVVIWSRYDYIY